MYDKRQSVIRRRSQPLIAFQMLQTLPVGLADDLQDHFRQGQKLSRVHAHVFLQDAHEQLAGSGNPPGQLLPVFCG